MHTSRRIFLRQSTLYGGAALALGNAGLCLAKWPIDVFENNPTDAAIDAMLRGAEATRSDKVQLTTPAEHQNPALVPVAVTSSLPEMLSLSLFADSANAPLLASFEFGRHPVTRLFTRIRVQHSTRAWALVKSGDEYFISEDSVKITPFRSQP